MNSDSCMIMATMDAGVAPSALRRPISRVRSFTTISMMLPDAHGAREDGADGDQPAEDA